MSVECDLVIINSNSLTLETGDVVQTFVSVNDILSCKKFHLVPFIFHY